MNGRSCVIKREPKFYLHYVGISIVPLGLICLIFSFRSWCYVLFVGVASIPLELLMWQGLHRSCYFCAATTEIFQVFSASIHWVSEVVRFRMRWPAAYCKRVKHSDGICYLQRVSYWLYWNQRDREAWVHLHELRSLCLSNTCMAKGNL